MRAEVCNTLNINTETIFDKYLGLLALVGALCRKNLSKSKSMEGKTLPHRRERYLIKVTPWKEKAVTGEVHLSVHHIMEFFSLWKLLKEVHLSDEVPNGILQGILVGIRVRGAISEPPPNHYEASGVEQLGASKDQIIRLTHPPKQILDYRPPPAPMMAKPWPLQALQ